MGNKFRNSRKKLARIHWLPIAVLLLVLLGGHRLLPDQTAKVSLKTRVSLQTDESFYPLAPYAEHEAEIETDISPLLETDITTDGSPKAEAVTGTDEAPTAETDLTADESLPAEADLAADESPNATTDMATDESPLDDLHTSTEMKPEGLPNPPMGMAPETPADLPPPAKEEAPPENEPAPPPETDFLPEIDMLPAPSAAAIQEITVYRYTDLKAALESKDITTIYLGASIVMEGGITINAGKEKLILDGTDPKDPYQTRHTLTEVNSNLLTENIVLLTSSTLKSITIRNMRLQGQNYFGVIFISDLVTGVTTTYENIVYTGPQLIYNRYGTAVIRNADIQIGSFGSISPANEVGEVGNIILAGKIDIAQTESQINEIFYFPLQGGAIEILPGAEVTISTAGESGFIYSVYNVRFHAYTGSSFRFTGINKFWDAGLYHLSQVMIEDYAKVHVTLTGTRLTPAFRVTNGLYVGTGAEFHVIAQQSLFSALRVQGNAVFDNPASVLLHSPDFRTLVYSIAGNMQLTAQQLNYWTTAAPGGFLNLPLRSWRKADKTDLTFTGQVAAEVAGDFTTINSNYTAADSSAAVPLTKEHFKLNASRVIAFGRLEIDAHYEYLGGHSARVIGTTTPEADIQLSYTDFSGQPVFLQAIADEQGQFAIPLPGTVADATVMTLAAHYQYLFQETTITASQNALHFIFVPPSMFFPYSALSATPIIVSRADPNWQISIYDSLAAGSRWRLTARLLDSEAQSGTTPLPEGSVVYVDEYQNREPLYTDSEVDILQHTSAEGAEMIPTQWTEDTGVLLNIQPGSVHAGKAYSASILWTLANAP